MKTVKSGVANSQGSAAGLLCSLITLTTVYTAGLLVGEHKPVALRLHY